MILPITDLEFLLNDRLVDGDQLLLTDIHQLLMCRYVEQSPHSMNRSVSCLAGQ